MALIECPECGRRVSIDAAACPECAYPVSAGRAPRTLRAGTPRKTRDRAKRVLHIVARLAVGAFLFGVGVGEEESVAAAIGGVLIAGSSIPVWVRARAAQLAAGATGLEERLTMLEQRHREQMAEFAQAQADHVADLEERVDFAERLLSKQREQLNS